MSVGDFFGYPAIASLVGALIGFVCTSYERSLQNKRNFGYQQLDRLYGPIFGLILQYQKHRKITEDIKKNIWKGQDKDFMMNSEADDDYEIMIKSSANECLKCSESITKLICSNIMYAQINDIASMHRFVEKFFDFNIMYGSSELPSIFSFYVVGSEIPFEFISIIKSSYDQLMSKIA